MIIYLYNKENFGVKCIYITLTKTTNACICLVHKYLNLNIYKICYIIYHLYIYEIFCNKFVQDLIDEVVFVKCSRTYYLHC